MSKERREKITVSWVPDSTDANECPCREIGCHGLVTEAAQVSEVSKLEVSQSLPATFRGLTTKSVLNKG